MRGASLLLVLALTACGGATSKLDAVQDLPADVAELVGETWERFEGAFAGRMDCMAPVSLLLVGDVPDGDAVYRFFEQRIEIEIPTSPARFPESLVHELAHHLEATCPEHAAIRQRFLDAQGFPPGTAWSSGDTWEQVPSEHFAEAVVQIVNGQRLLHDDLVHLSPRAVDLVRAWGRG